MEIRTARTFTVCEIVPPTEHPEIIEVNTIWEAYLHGWALRSIALQAWYPQCELYLDVKVQAPVPQGGLKALSARLLPEEPIEAWPVLPGWVNDWAAENGLPEGIWTFHEASKGPQVSKFLLIPIGSQSTTTS